MPTDPTPTPRLRVLLRTDLEIVAAALAALLDSDDRLETTTVDQPAADVVLVDSMATPELDAPGADRLRSEVQLAGDRPVVLLTGKSSTAVGQPLVIERRVCLIDRATPADRIGDALVAAARGEHVMVGAEAARTATGWPFPSLSEREAEVLALLADGATNRAIAERLVVSPETVKTYVRRIFDKLGVRNRAQAAAWAVRHTLRPA